MPELALDDVERDGGSAGPPCSLHLSAGPSALGRRSRHRPAARSASPILARLRRAVRGAPMARAGRGRSPGGDVGEGREQQPVAASSRASSRRSSTSGSGSRFFGVRRTWAGSRSSSSFSTRKRKKPLSAATVRAWLEDAGGRVDSAARKRRRSARPHFGERLDPRPLEEVEAGAHVALVGGAGERRHRALPRRGGDVRRPPARSHRCAQREPRPPSLRKSRSASVGAMSAARS